MVVSVDTRGSFKAGIPQPLFDDVYAGRDPTDEPQYDVAADGRAFVFIEHTADGDGPTRLVLVPDWASELRAKLRSAKK
jgi:hypothetical protein